MKINLPNKISLTRIILLPFFVFFYLSDFIVWGKLIAAVIFVIAAATDFMDGKIARKRNIVTNLGKFLDPIADKLIITAALVLVIADGTILSPYGEIITIIIISRELIVSGLRQIAATGGVIISADKWGKIKAVFQDIGVASAMVLAQLNVLNVAYDIKIYFEVFTYATLIIATVLTIISGYNYVYKNRNVFNSQQ